jgi:hypothetical protein
MSEKIKSGWQIDEFRIFHPSIFRPRTIGTWEKSNFTKLLASKKKDKEPSFNRTKLQLQRVRKTAIIACRPQITQTTSITTHTYTQEKKNYKSMFDCRYNFTHEKKASPRNTHTHTRSVAKVMYQSI